MGDFRSDLRTDLATARGRRRRHDPAAHETARQVLQRRAAQVRDRVPIKDVVERVVGKMKRAGRAWVARCPFHADTTASLAVYPEPGDRVPVPFWVCYGCEKKGDVIKFVMERQKLDWREAIEFLESENGLSRLVEAAPPPMPKTPQVLDRDKLDKAHRIWKAGVALAKGGVVDQYFRGRFLVPPADYGVGGDPEVNAGWPEDLRFLPRCWHDLERREFPALLAAIRAPDGTLLTVHRTYLAQRPDGSWGKAPVEKAKLVVGSYGSGFIRLGPDADDMGGGEGIETSLSAMQLFKRSGIAFVTAGRMKSVEPPFCCHDFIYWADKGAKAGKKAWGEIFAHQGAKADYNRGRKVSVQIPNIDLPKADFNDLLKARATGDWVPAKARQAKPVAPAPEVKRGLPATKDTRPLSRRPPAAVVPEISTGERAAYERVERARTELALVNRTDEAALTAAVAELEAAYAAWRQAIAGRTTARVRVA